MTIEHAKRLLNPDRGTMQVIRCTAAVAAIEADVASTRDIELNSLGGGYTSLAG
ncbi:MAG: hypothetical protein IPG66_10700 [Hydrogenophilales bacterium]|nr:hypothetical protein [Hydrogenophilales bacterium]